MTATYSLKLSDGEVVHFASDNNKPVAQIKADAFRVDVIDKQSSYGMQLTAKAKYQKAYRERVKR